jgi:hypothetical protein
VCGGVQRLCGLPLPRRRRARGRLAVPARKVTACTFGGEHLDQLFITTSQENINTREDPLAGSLFRTNVGVKGLPVRPLCRLRAPPVRSRRRSPLTPASPLRRPVCRGSARRAVEVCEPQQMIASRVSWKAHPRFGTGSWARSVSTPCYAMNRRGWPSFAVAPNLDMAGARGAALATLTTLQGQSGDLVHR